MFKLGSRGPSISFGIYIENYEYVLIDLIKPYPTHFVVICMKNLWEESRDDDYTRKSFGEHNFYERIL